MTLLKTMSIRQRLAVMLLITALFFASYNVIYYNDYREESVRWAVSSANQMMNQVEDNVQNMVDNIESTSDGFGYSQNIQQLILTDDSVRNFELYQYYQQVVYATKKSNDIIHGVWLLGDNGRWISDPVSDGNDVIQKMAERLPVRESSFNRARFSGVIEGPPSVYYFCYAFPIYSILTGSPSKIGGGVLLLKISELQELISISNITENAMFCVLDADNLVITSNGKLNTGDLYDDIFWDAANDSSLVTETEIDDIRYIAQYRKLSDTGWSVVSLIPIEELTSGMRSFLIRMIVFTVCGIVLLSLLDVGIMRSVAVSIEKLVAFLENEQNRDLDERVEASSQKDIAVIAVGVNHMLDRVENMTNSMIENQTKLYEMKLAERDAEISALQSQIDPHFLYNTLNCLSNIGYAYDIPEVSDISVAMASIYRYSIAGNRFARLSQELQLIHEYIRIMEIRFPEKFELTIQVNEELMELFVLRMTLQPIVENAFQHGLEMKNGKGHLRIAGEVAENNTLILSIANDGKLISSKELEEIYANMENYEKREGHENGKTKVGLANINKRIKLLFGDDYGVNVESCEEKGTVVQVRMPIIKENSRNLI